MLLSKQDTEPDGVCVGREKNLEIYLSLQSNASGPNSCHFKPLNKLFFLSDLRVVDKILFFLLPKGTQKEAWLVLPH